MAEVSSVGSNLLWGRECENRSRGVGSGRTSPLSFIRAFYALEFAQGG